MTNSGIITSVRLKIIFYALLLYLFVSPTPAHAYLDPGSGSYIFQMIIAGLLGIMLTAKTSWKKLLGRIARILKPRDENKSET